MWNDHCEKHLNDRGNCYYCGMSMAEDPDFPKAVRDWGPKGEALIDDGLRGPIRSMLNNKLYSLLEIAELCMQTEAASMQPSPSAYQEACFAELINYIRKLQTDIKRSRKED